MDSTYGARYDRLEENSVNTSDAVEYLYYKDSGNGNAATVRWLPVADRDLVDYVENKAGATVVSKYDYSLDVFGRRTAAVLTGTAFSCNDIGEHHWDFAYNDRSELTGGDRKSGTTPGAGTALSASATFGYAYDPIGNRISSVIDSRTRHYCVDEDGSGFSTNRYVTIDDEDSCPPNTAGESLSYDDDGILTADNHHAYTWDAENRLIAISPAGTAVVNDKKLEFKYDYMGRRVEKTYSIYNGSSWIEQTKQRFVYDQWNPVLVLDGSNDVVRKYTWGLDLSGLSGDTSAFGIHGAGGIGGLLAAVETTGTHQGTYWFTYDGNGNVGQVLNATNPASITVAAHYEYDPYGNTIFAAGDYASANPIRFSTKWLDAELGGWSFKGAAR